MRCLELFLIFLTIVLLMTWVPVPVLNCQWLYIYTVTIHTCICSATTGKECPEACQKDYKSLADIWSNLTLFLGASLIIFSPHAR